MKFAEYYKDLDETLADKDTGLGNLELLGYGVFEESAYAAFGRWRYWRDLFRECFAVIHESADVEFIGGPSAAFVLDCGFKRYAFKAGAKCIKGHWHFPDPRQALPPVWFLITAKLAKMPAESQAA